MSHMRLPSEIIELIAHCLAEHYPLSLEDLALVKKRCYACSRHVAKSVAFRTIRSSHPNELDCLHGPKEPSSDIEGLSIQ